jgi:uncharacterized ParB-like nuclease family protein
MTMSTATAAISPLLEQLTAKPKQIERIQLAKITERIQLRTGTDAEAVTRYAEAYAAGADALPPIVVFESDEGLFVADGCHRCAAADKAGLKSLLAIVKKGDRRDAVLFAAGANDQHGVGLTNADKRRIVETVLADAEWAKWSDREIARRCHVSNTLVSSVRPSVSGAQTKTRKSKDGREREVTNIGRGMKLPKIKKPVVLPTASEIRAKLGDEQYEELMVAIEQAIEKKPGMTGAEFEAFFPHIVQNLSEHWPTVAETMHSVRLVGGRWQPVPEEEAADKLKEEKVANLTSILLKAPMAFKMHPIKAKVMAVLFFVPLGQSEAAITKAIHSKLEGHGRQLIKLGFVAENGGQFSLTSTGLIAIQDAMSWDLAQRSDQEDAAAGSEEEKPVPKSKPTSLADRRAVWIRDTIADKLEAGKIGSVGVAQACALVLITGLEDGQERYSHDLVERGGHLLAEAVAKEVAYHLREGSNKLAQLPTLPDLCRIFHADYDSLVAQAAATVTE